MNTQMVALHPDYNPDLDPEINDLMVRLVAPQPGSQS
jgi:hypothetical protein